MPFKTKESLIAYQREWMARGRASYFAGKSCVNCGSKESLELDHIDPEKKVTHRIWNWSKERREIELAKCQPLCHDCHVEKTKKWYADKRRHGTVTMYSHGCRCYECKSKAVGIAVANKRKRKQLQIAPISSNGRTADSESVN